MSGAPRGNCWEELYPDGVCHVTDFIRSGLDQQIVSLPSGVVSNGETRYPVDEPSMRAFLETFFTRHLFQVQRSLIEYVVSPDFQNILRSGPVRLLDIGSGPAVASLATIDLVHRVMHGVSWRPAVYPRAVRMVHVLNDTSSICLATGKRLLEACHRLGNHNAGASPNDRVFTLSTAFPNNIPQIQYLGSFLGGYDVVILSYVVHPLIDDCGLRELVTAVRILERLCRPDGRILIVQDRFHESVVRRLAHMLGVTYEEQTVTQEIYPARGSNETYTYTYYDCLYAPRNSVARQTLGA